MYESPHDPCAPDRSLKSLLEQLPEIWARIEDNVSIYGHRKMSLDTRFDPLANKVLSCEHWMPKVIECCHVLAI
jgi:hypothetical protein